LAAPADELRVVAPSGTQTAGEVLEARLVLQGSGRIQGISARLGWNPAVVEPVDYMAGELLASLGGMALSPEPGVVDAVLLGVGSAGFTGEGDLATVRFLVRNPGDPGIALAASDARDADNRRVTLGVTPPRDMSAAPRVTALLGNTPNPFNPSTRIDFALAEAGTIEISVFDAVGRHVRTLLTASRPAGLHSVVWDGTDRDGRRVASGVYYARLVTPRVTDARRVVLVE
jgi:hypothetical protein